MILQKPIKLQVERYIGGLSQFKKIDNPIKLSANESALGPSPKAIQAFEKDKDKIFKYPESESNSLREVLSEKFNIDHKRIICGSGSDQIFDLTCHLFLEPGDEVIVTEFGFIMHRIYASLHKAQVVLSKEKNFKASVDEILKKVTLLEGWTMDKISEALEAKLGLNKKGVLALCKNRSFISKTGIPSKS